jgi:hypothetical protein
MRKRLTTIFGAVTCFVGMTVNATPATTTLYYIGEAITTSNSRVERHPFLLARTSDVDHNTISETVVSFDGQAKMFKENSSVLKIDQNHFTLTEPTGSITGTGELTGLPWQWTFLKAEFKAPKLGLRIIDYNFFAEPGLILGHKDLYLQNKTGTGETLATQEDVVLRSVDKPTFDSKRSELLGH